MIPVSCEGCEKACDEGCHCYTAYMESLEDKQTRQDLLGSYCEPITGMGV